MRALQLTLCGACCCASSGSVCLCSCVGGVVVKLCIYIVHGVCGSSGSSVYIFVCVSIVWCWCCIVHNYVEHRYECEHVYVVWKTVAGCVCVGGGGGGTSKHQSKVENKTNIESQVCSLFAHLLAKGYVKA